MILGFASGHPAIGDIVEVVDFNFSKFTGRIVADIKAGEAPDINALKPHFTKQEVFKNMTRFPMPTRPSKYRRLVVEIHPGRSISFAVDRYTTIRPGSERNLHRMAADRKW